MSDRQPIDWGEVLSAAEVLRDAAAEIDRLVSKSNPNETNLSELARIAILAQESDQILGHALEMLGAWVVVMMEGDEVDVPGVGHLTRKWSKNWREWKNDRLLSDVLSKARTMNAPHGVDPETGEMIFTFDQAVAALSEVYNLSGNNARLRAIRALGLSADDYAKGDDWRARLIARRFEEDEISDDDR